MAVDTKMQLQAPTERLRRELARLRQVVEDQGAMTRYAARLAVLWERRWEKLRATLLSWHTAPVEMVLVEMRQIESRVDIEEPEPVACEVSTAELGQEGAHHCHTHRVWFSTPTGESRTPCPVGRVETELAKLRGNAKLEKSNG